MASDELRHIERGMNNAAYELAQLATAAEGVLPARLVQRIVAISAKASAIARIVKAKRGGSDGK